MLIVWSLPNCPRCHAVQSFLQAGGYEHKSLSMQHAVGGDLHRDDWDAGCEFHAFRAMGEIDRTTGTFVRDSAPQVFHVERCRWWTEEEIEIAVRSGEKGTPISLSRPLDTFPAYRCGLPYAQKWGKRIPHEKEGLLQKIADNEGFCVCEKDKVSETVCPCVRLRNEGVCRCGLWV